MARRCECLVFLVCFGSRCCACRLLNSWGTLFALVVSSWLAFVLGHHHTGSECGLIHLLTESKLLVLDQLCLFLLQMEIRDWLLPWCATIILQ